MFRSRNKIFNDLLNNQDSKQLAKDIAHQISYLDRRVTRSEFAKRISNIEKGYLQRVVLDWFFDSDLSIVAWGPVHQVVAHSHYNRPIKRSSLGWYGSAQYFVH
jgi:predicted Zn-dependent peptidase